MTNPSEAIGCDSPQVRIPGPANTVYKPTLNSSPQHFPIYFEGCYLSLLLNLLPITLGKKK